MKQDQYRCEECGAAFGSQSALEEHNRMNHSRFTFEACGEMFRSERDLEEHNRQLHPEMQKPRR